MLRHRVVNAYNLFRNDERRFGGTLTLDVAFYTTFNSQPRCSYILSAMVLDVVIFDLLAERLLPCHDRGARR